MNIAVIFAGGSGRRMRSNGIPKQFLQVNGVPIIIHTLRVFQESMDIDAIVLACVPEYMEHMKKLAARYEIDKLRRIVPGGETGQESIYFGLKAAQEIAEPGSIVLIHDGVRPLIDGDLISRNIASVREFGSGISVVPGSETITVVDEDGEIGATVQRSSCWIARAPQSFLLDQILPCHEKARAEGLQFVDSCTLMLHFGYRLHRVETSYQNIKITTPEDYYIFKALLSAKENAQILGL